MRLQLVRHLRVHLGRILVRVLDMMVLSVLLVLRVHLRLVVEVRSLLMLTHVSIRRRVSETVSRRMRALHSV